MGQNKGYLTAKRTKKSDECYTPKYAVTPILEFIKNKFKVVWCPFDNISSEYVKVLKSEGFKVINTHLEKGKDFLKMKPPKNYDIIISNPPYSIKDDVIKKCYDLKKPFMLLLPLPALQSKKRYDSFKNGLELLVFDGRINFFANGFTHKTQQGNSFASIYFCKDVLPSKLIFRQLSNKEI